MKRQTDKQIITELRKERTFWYESYLEKDKLRWEFEQSFKKAQAINTELKAEVDTLRNQVTAYTHTLEFKEGQIKAYRDMLRLNNGN